MRTRLITILVLALASGCDSTDDDAEQTDDVQDPGELVLATDSVTLQPGEEKWLCWQVQVPEDGDSFPLVGIDFVVSDEVHHYELQAASSDQSGGAPYWDCGMGGEGAPDDGGADGGEPPGDGMMGGAGGLPVMLAVGGPGSSREMRFPSGTVAMLEPGSYLVLQQHIFNPRESAHEFPSATAKFLRPETAADDLQPIGVALVNDENILIPPQSTGVEAGIDCQLAAPLEHVFLVWPHMHTLGKEIQVTIGDEPVVDHVWNFGAQEFVETDVRDATSVDLRCVFDNPTDREVTFGMRTLDEMCTAFVFYYPLSPQVGICE